MPLHKERGEVIGDLGKNYRVVPNSKWRDTQFFEEAARHAAEAFLATKALAPIYFDDEHVLTQEYPLSHKLAFIFCKTCRGKERFYPFVFNLGPGLVGELIAANRWEPVAN